MAATNKTPQKSALSSSTMTTTTTTTTTTIFVLWSVFCFGLGVLGGFGTLFVLYETQCQALVQTAQEGSLEQARAQVRRDIDECQFHNQALRVQLETQRKQWQEDVDAHHVKVAALQDELQQQTDESSRQLAAALEQQQQHQQQENAAARQDNAKMQELVQETHRLQQALAEIQHAKAQQDHEAAAAAVAQFTNLQTALQHRFEQQTKLKYGGATMLQIELTLDLGTPDLQTLVVQVDRLHVMPMTIATFLYLLEAGLYTGTQILPAQQDNDDDDDDKGILHGGQLPTTEQATRIADRWAVHGYAREAPLLWPREATVRQAPCPRYGVGLDWSGQGRGDFFIQLDLSAAQQRPCLGRVVSGMNLLHPHTQGTLAHARIRPAPAGATDEL